MINEVPYDQVLEIRHKVMYPDKPKDSVILPDDKKGLHIGYYKDDKPVSIVSLFLNLETKELQFRKLATLVEFQNRGYGSQLVRWILDYTKDLQFPRVWCNARVEKIDFYKKFGFTETDQVFEKNGFKYVVLEKCSF
ncbi:GNAT family N-acetyltransferase [Dysgonomonas macrotermitis]|uniref:Acetyltransferase (GNAT) domain-containing protein n=1 Tax=Dysgonomonas macrotermitis TaxID=1346286 RepID=A0A1M5EFQ6_9BACT|nr:GNAT family N-acetyltransferase [Dysgonomonas macrotermitis]SHF78000.1 Acetyltransferase (GNAT) domain-containing protein [Dysgonomonas macrotermitis]